MRRSSFHFVVTLLLGALGAMAAQNAPDSKTNGAQYVGTWSGRWEAAGSAGGGFELTIDKGSGGALAGGVSVTGEPTYKATLKKVSFDGDKMTAAYDFTPDDQAEVLLAATFEGTTAKGTWSLRATTDGTEVAAGTWNVTRK
jgi:hypothetical protein